MRGGAELWGQMGHVGCGGLSGGLLEVAPGVGGVSGRLLPGSDIAL